MVTLSHAQYPDTGCRGWVKHSRHVTVRAARRAVHKFYAGKVGWWYQITKNGVEVYSSDHEVAGHPLP
jgi:hypothetical protein